MAQEVCSVGGIMDDEDEMPRLRMMRLPLIFASFTPLRHAHASAEARSQRWRAIRAERADCSRLRWLPLARCSSQRRNLCRDTFEVRHTCSECVAFARWYAGMIDAAQAQSRVTSLRKMISLFRATEAAA